MPGCLKSGESIRRILKSGSRVTGDIDLTVIFADRTVFLCAFGAELVQHFAIGGKEKDALVLREFEGNMQFCL